MARNLLLHLLIWRQNVKSFRMRRSTTDGVTTEADLAQCDGSRLPPPFLFCGCWCNFFSPPPSSSLVQDEILARRQRAAITYDNHHRVQASLPELEAGDYVYVKPPPHRKGHAWSYGQITRLVEPRSCVIRTSSGEVHRNRAQVRMAAPPPPPVTVSTPAITSTSATPVSSQSALPAPAPQFPSAKSATSQFPLATSASSNPAVQPTVSSRCDPPHEAQTPQSSLQSSVCASGDSSQKSLSQMAPYKTRSGRVVKSPKVFDPSDNV